MVIHKKTRLTPVQRKEICDKHFKDKIRVSDLSRDYHVSRPTIYKILHRGRKNELKRFVNYYNWVKPHKGIDGLTPGEKLLTYFYPEKL